MTIEETAQRLLGEFNKIPIIDPHQSDIAIRTLTARRAPLIKQLADLDYKPAASYIFDYLQKTRLTTEVTASIEALGRLGYVEAIPFIRSRLEGAKRWYNAFSSNARAKSTGLIKEQINVAQTALDSLVAIQQSSRQQPSQSTVYQPNQSSEYPTTINT
jgi:hypothetical protein